MERIGKVMTLDSKSNTGTIRDQQGRDWFFSAEECEAEQLPALYSVVLFAKDDDFKSTEVAVCIRLYQGPRKI